MKAQRYMSPQEVQLCRMTPILFFTFGLIAGALLFFLWAMSVVVIVVSAGLVYVGGELIWKRLACRILRYQLAVRR